jgi:hypothetical protein
MPAARVAAIATFEVVRSGKDQKRPFVIEVFSGKLGSVAVCFPHFS